MTLSVIFIILSAFCRKLSEKMINRDLLKRATKNVIVNTLLFFIKDTKNLFIVLASLFVGYSITTYVKMWGAVIDPFVYFAIWGASHVVFSTIFEAIAIARGISTKEIVEEVEKRERKRPNVSSSKNIKFKK